MKELIDGSKVPDRMYYYLLEWNEKNNKIAMAEKFEKQRLCDLNFEEFSTLFELATSSDQEYLRENLEA